MRDKYAHLWVAQGRARMLLNSFFSVSFPFRYLVRKGLRRAPWECPGDASPVLGIRRFVRQPVQHGFLHTIPICRESPYAHPDVYFRLSTSDENNNKSSSVMGSGRQQQEPDASRLLLLLRFTRCMTKKLGRPTSRERERERENVGLSCSRLQFCIQERAVRVCLGYLSRVPYRTRLVFSLSLFLVHTDSQENNRALGGFCLPSVPTFPRTKTKERKGPREWPSLGYPPRWRNHSAECPAPWKALPHHLWFVCE